MRSVIPLVQAGAERFYSQKTGKSLEVVLPSPEVVLPVGQRCCQDGMRRCAHLQKGEDEFGAQLICGEIRSHGAAAEAAKVTTSPQGVRKSPHERARQHATRLQLVWPRPKVLRRVSPKRQLS